MRGRLGRGRGEEGKRGRRGGKRGEEGGRGGKRGRDSESWESPSEKKKGPSK